MMELVPPVGWGEVATKRDLDNLALTTKRDIENLALTTKRDIENLALVTKRDLDNLALTTKRDIEKLALTTKRDIENLGDKLRGEWSRQAVAMVISIVTANAATTALIVSVARLTG